MSRASGFLEVNVMHSNILARNEHREKLQSHAERDSRELEGIISSITGAGYSAQYDSILCRMTIVKSGRFVWFSTKRASHSNIGAITLEAKKELDRAILKNEPPCRIA